MKVKQFVKVLAKVIAIPCGCLCLLAVLAFLLLINLFKASPSDIRKGNETLKQIFISLDLPPEKIESNGKYQFEGGGLDFYVTFSDEVINSRPVLKESPKLTKNRLKVYVLQTGDISYYKVGDNLFNHGLIQFLEEEGEKYFRENGKKSNSSYTILNWKDQESLKKGITFYEKALTLVDIQDNSAIKHIDTITVKPGKEAEIKQLIQEMDAAGLLTQKYK
ncbi:hypothetical protein KX728_01815 [Streptococcus oralis]|uniref:hypothetical protein n=1 Tax=Streptococcus oralis TaxID=1303 RepID=UPI001C05B0D5|nr:hypothetical protein [Streptococcus oralis]MBU0454839.1 hypothetical protein [Streptococcus oralis]MBZ2095365.1 hypothetical protein [Streptococcus oralis]MBZ2099017.1 hypothetical protein [Streptococcus oralis]QXW61749.1 hypothetical protein KX728_01815 [Streptococcus oralis]